MAKYLSLTLPSVQIAWIRFLVFALIFLPAMLTTTPNIFRSVRPGIQLCRGITLLSSSLFFIIGLRYLPIAEASQRLSQFPADYLGITERGRLQPGAWADCVRLDRSLTLTAVMVEGEDIDFKNA